MKKVIPKKKNAFLIIPVKPVETDNSNFGRIQSPSLQSSSMSCSNSARTEVSMGVAGENINAGDLLMVRMEDGLITRFTGPEGRKNV